MFNTFRTAVLSAVVGLGALAAMPASAQADSFFFGITSGGPTFGYHMGQIRPGFGGHHRDHKWNRPGRAACSTPQALHKAGRLGLNRTYVRTQNHRVIRVGGMNRGRHVTVAFAKAPNCPIIR